MKRVMTVVAAVVAAAATAGCSGKQDTTSSLDPTAQPAQWQDGIYVASYHGDDANAGSAISPMRTINAAIEKARSEGKRDVWIYGGGFNAGYPEVVVLKAGINLRGSICKTDNPPAQSDASCLSSIVGGSPSLVAIDVRENTIVENLEIAGLPGVQSGGPNEGFFEVAGIGCVGRGITNNRLPSCERPLDKEGRMTPFSSVAVALSRSNAVFFRNVNVIASEGARGLDGTNGTDGANGIMSANGLIAGDAPFKAGAGAKAAVPAACPEAKGGNGGQGGSFRWTNSVAFSETTCLTKAECAQHFSATAVNGGSAGGDSFLGANSVAGSTPYQGRQLGLIGVLGGAGSNGEIGGLGIAGLNLVDLVSLAAFEGDAGDEGFAGHGGSGGAGGNPATRRIYEKRMSSGGNSTSLIGYAGAAFSGSQVSMYESEEGELAGSGGGAGGSGGCGGEGGRGGQGGASSVGVYLADSTITFDGSLVRTGAGGAGGEGGAGGFGGIGAEGSQGGATRSVGAESVMGSLSSASAGGIFLLSSNQQYSMQYEKAYSAATSGAGGAGGRGGLGGRGGQGGAGAGGSSIGVAVKGESTVLGTVLYELGAAGEPGDENGEAGRVVELLSL